MSMAITEVTERTFLHTIDHRQIALNLTIGLLMGIPIRTLAREELDITIVMTTAEAVVMVKEVTTLINQ